MVNELLPIAAVKLGLQLDELRAHFRGLDLLHKFSFNAHVSKLTRDNSDFRIEVNEGLYFFCNDMSEVFASRMSGWPPMAKILDNPIISFSELVSVAEARMKAFWLQRIGPLYPSVSPVRFRLTRQQVSWSNDIADHVFRFVLAHELGHVLIDYHKIHDSKLSLPALNEGYRSAESSFAHICDRADSSIREQLKCHPQNRVIETWGEEFAADLLGLELCIDSSKDSFGEVLPYWSALFSFTFLEMLENYYQLTNDSLIDLGSHPYATLRRRVIEESVGVLTLTGDMVPVEDLPRFFLELSKKIIGRLRESREMPLVEEMLFSKDFTISNSCDDEKKDSLAYYDIQIKANPIDAKLYFQRGIYYFDLQFKPDIGVEKAIEQGFFEKAVHDFSKVISLLPSLKKAYYFRALCRYSLGCSNRQNFDLSISDFDHFIALAAGRDPDLADAHFMRGQCHQIQGNLPKFVDDLEHFIKLAPPGREDDLEYSKEMFERLSKHWRK